MISYFTRLINYDYQSNLTIIDAILSSGITEGKHIGIMAHLLAAQQIWLKRCQKLPAPGGLLWPECSAGELKAIATQNHQGYIELMESLQEDDLKQPVTYTNSRGDTFTNSLEDILAHLINHGTHHRAQVGQQLKFAGVEQLPPTDYILYIRQLS